MSSLNFDISSSIFMLKVPMDSSHQARLNGVVLLKINDTLNMKIDEEISKFRDNITI